jgi:mannose-6-phosphate isomerase-like protein (cupin superfamily)
MPSKAVGSDEVREFPKGKLEIAKIGGSIIGRATFEPGWKWSESVKPIAGTDSCQKHHNGYVVSGRLHVKMDDGTEMEMGAGDAYEIPAGHDGWVVGDEPCVSVDFDPDIAGYAKK